MTDHNHWSILQSNLIFENRWITLYQDKVVTNKGETMDYTWYKSSDVVVIVPFFNDDTIIMIRQFRYPLQKVLLEFPAGHIEDGEDIEETAKRELLEETGYITKKINYVYSYYPSVSKSRQKVHVFMATDLVEDKPSHESTEDIINIERLSVTVLKKMIKEGEVESAGTLVAFFICSINGYF